ncbi:hypothetical protein NEOLEDRAFT_1142324 [Neolentinus lepideus HHB14362 ss-1]|uniref:Uncharacterized protein n=1 Tax=Neolentinus lepideus HHB14362 ss-1 TaxID=1314782 RepID=A0A165N638_9AGAM|nr:hypothetical protein NEOLEDRAFT_1142324 [Neolentinus lepideus HHB14362 ss-1]
MLPHVLCFVLTLLSFVRAQETLTIPDPNNPLTSIVEIITVTTDLLGLPTTRTLETLPYTATTTTPTTTAPTTTAPTTTTPLVQTTPTTTTTTTPPMVVGQPGATPGTGAIPYQYTTTNAAGATIVVQDTFTPSFALITSVAPTSTGSVLDYSQWLSSVGTNTVAAHSISSASAMWGPSGAFWGAAITSILFLWPGSGLRILR